MNRNSLLLILLITALGLVDLCVFKWLASASSSQNLTIRPPHHVALIIIALAMSQTGLMAVWFSMSQGNLLLKLFTNISLLSVWSNGLGLLSMQDQAWLRILFSQSLSIILICSLHRHKRFLTLRKKNFAPLRLNNYRPKFSLSFFMQWITCIALFMIVFRNLDFRLFDSFPALIGCLLFTVAICLSAWSANPERLLAHRIAVPLVLLPVLGALISSFDTSLPMWSYSLLTGMISVLVSLIMTALHISGIVQSIHMRRDELDSEEFSKSISLA